jgi:hypothetical protein
VVVVVVAGAALLGAASLPGVAGSEHALEAVQNSSHTPQNLDHPVLFILAAYRRLIGMSRANSS